MIRQANFQTSNFNHLFVESLKYTKSIEYHCYCYCISLLTEGDYSSKFLIVYSSFAKRVTLFHYCNNLFLLNVELEKLHDSTELMFTNNAIAVLVDCLEDLVNPLLRLWFIESTKKYYWRYTLRLRAEINRIESSYHHSSRIFLLFVVAQTLKLLCVAL